MIAEFLIWRAKKGQGGRNPIWKALENIAAAVIVRRSRKVG